MAKTQIDTFPQQLRYFILQQTICFIEGEWRIRDEAPIEINNQYDFVYTADQLRLAVHYERMFAKHPNHNLQTPQGRHELL